MDKKTNKIINDYVEHVAKSHSNLLKVFLFGSFAKKKETPNSDIDIAANKFDYRIEPHPISNYDFIAEYPFALEIKNTGLEINFPFYR